MLLNSKCKHILGNEIYDYLCDHKEESLYNIANIHNLNEIVDNQFRSSDDSTLYTN